MAECVYKFDVEPGYNEVEMPAGARLLHVHAYGPEVFLWARVDTKAPTARRRIEVAGTGPAPALTVESLHLRVKDPAASEGAVA